MRMVRRGGQSMCEKKGTEKKGKVSRNVHHCNKNVIVYCSRSSIMVFYLEIITLPFHQLAFCTLVAVNFHLPLTPITIDLLALALPSPPGQL